MLKYTEFQKDFYLHYEKLGDEFLYQKKIHKAGKYYSRAFELNPVNFLLMSRIADTVFEMREAKCLYPILCNAVQNALKFLGEDRSVFDIARTVSFINKKIMRAHNAIYPFNCFSPPSTVAVSRPIRLVLLTCIWQRPALTEVVLSYYQWLSQYLSGQLDLVLLAIGSEGKYSRKLCERFGFCYFEHENLPLSDKWEFGIKKSRQFSPDAVITVGSDDLLSSSLLLKYADFLKNGILFCGLSDSYFFNFAEKKELLYWRGYGGATKVRGMPWRLNETIGMGRMYSRDLLDFLEYSFWPDVHINKGLDRAIKERIVSFGILPVLKDHALPIYANMHDYQIGQIAFSLEDLKGCALDIKTTSINVTSIENYVACKDSFHVIENPWLLLKQHFPIDTIEGLQSLV